MTLELGQGPQGLKGQQHEMFSVFLSIQIYDSDCRFLIFSDIGGELAKMGKR